MHHSVGSELGVCSRHALGLRKRHCRKLATYEAVDDLFVGAVIERRSVVLGTELRPESGGSDY